MYRIRLNEMMSSNRVIKRVLRDCRRFLREPREATMSSGLLICFPLDEQHRNIALRVFLPLLESDSGNVLVMIPAQARQMIDFVDDKHVIEISIPQDIQKEPLLPVSVNECLREYRFTVAVDLNTEHHPYTAAAVLKSAAEKRIGFVSTYSDKFFNIQMSRKVHDPVESSYRNIYKIILDKKAE